MSTIKSWEPCQSPVHALIQICDVLAISLNRFRQLSFRIPSPPDPHFVIEQDRLLADYHEITRMIFTTKDIAPQHTASRLAADAVAELTRAGSDDEQCVCALQEWMTTIGWILVPEVYPSWTTSHQWHTRFDNEGQILMQYPGIRRGLIAALARVGQQLPIEIHRRMNYFSHSWAQSQAEPVAQVQLISWVSEANQAIAAEWPNEVAKTPICPQLGETTPAGPKTLKARAEKEKSARAQLNAYELVRAALSKLPKGTGASKLLAHFRSDKDFRELVTVAGKKFDKAFFHAALKYIQKNPTRLQSR